MNLCRDILINGKRKHDRTGTGTTSIFGHQSKYDLNKGFPIVTTKKVFFNGIVGELLWFISGSTNIKSLVEQKINIWNEWPYKKFVKSENYKGESIQDFKERIVSNDSFAKKWGDLGPVYGKQWRQFNGYDQFNKVLENMKTNPASRRHIVSAWNPAEIDDMLLPPCHLLFQFYINDGKVSLQLYQRSADVFLGVPFNISSYSLLVHLVANHLGLGVGEFVHTIGDAHIYDNHLDQVREQILRKPKNLPSLNLANKNKNIFKVKLEDISLENYHPHPPIKGKVSV